LPTAIPTPVAAASPSAGSSAAVALLALVAGAEANLRSGELEGRVEYGSGAQSRAVVTFDLGGDVRPPRVHSVVTSSLGTSDRTVERITVGEQSWERRRDGSWGA